jgi:cytochrome c
LIFIAVKDNFEFDKVVISIALSVFVLIFSANLGGFLYRTKNIPDTKGFQVEIIEAGASDGAAAGLPEKIEIGKIMAAAVADAGKSIFNKCAICHTAGKGEANKVGPNLWGIVGAVTARHAEFQYSSAMSELGKASHKWTYEELYRYLYAPKKHVPGTKMAFAGLKKDEDRANVIAYLRSLADSPSALPPVEK